MFLIFNKRILIKKTLNIDYLIIKKKKNFFFNLSLNKNNFKLIWIIFLLK
jgi:hypothetical protein